MNASRHRLLIALLLPLLALRMLLPGGFMPVVEAGELRIVMCAEGLPGPAGDDGHPATEDGSDCPFAQTSLNAPPMRSAMLVALPAPGLLSAFSFDSNLPATTGPPRATAARAPPFSS